MSKQLPIGTRVENQSDPRILGTVIGPGPEGLPDWIKVRWDDGRTFDEDQSDVTEVITSNQYPYVGTREDFNRAKGHDADFHEAVERSTGEWYLVCRPFETE